VRDLSCIALTGNGAWAATGDAGGAVRLWRVGTGVETARRELPSGVLDVQLNPGGTLLASAHRDGSVRLWSVEGLQEQRLLRP